LSPTFESSQRTLRCRHIVFIDSAGYTKFHRLPKADIKYGWGCVTRIDFIEKTGIFWNIITEERSIFNTKTIFPESDVPYGRLFLCIRRRFGIRIADKLGFNLIRTKRVSSAHKSVRTTRRGYSSWRTGLGSLLEDVSDKIISFTTGAFYGYPTSFAACKETLGFIIIALITIVAVVASTWRRI